MKFIRDIIDEKRKMDAAVSEAPELSVAEAGLDAERKPASSHDTAMLQFEKGMIEDIDDLPDGLPDAHIQDSLGETDDEGPAGPDVSDQVSRFLDETDEPEAFEANSVDTEAAVPGWQAMDMADPGRMDSTMDKAEDGAPAFSPEDAVIRSEQMQDRDNHEELDSSLKEVFAADSITDEPNLSEVESPAQSKSVTTPDHFRQGQAIANRSTVADQARPEMSVSGPDTARPDVPSQLEPVPVSAAAMPQRVEVPQPAVGRGASRHGRVKTRLLGFNTLMETDTDPMADNEQASAAPYTSFPVGWLIVIEGAGRGSAFTLFHGVSTIGRGENQTVRLDFGDNSISRENHASIAYDARQQGFYIGHGGKTNIVRRNDRPVLSTEEIAAGDHITIGETTLRFVPFCCPDFSWERKTESGQAYAHQG